MASIPPFEELNGNIPGLPDKISRSFYFDMGYSHLRIINIWFEKGYDDAEEMRIKVNNVPMYNLIEYKKKGHNKEIGVVPIDEPIPFRYSAIEITLESKKPFKVKLNCQYEN